ncbi:MAG: metallophosphoesterase family protein, partial [Gemmatimonadaceae bacterium]|nr:metallophosphoesterase family protein [Gemmatimonadaceae bacterium]
ALDAVLADVDARGDVDATYHLGDLVGYSAFPNDVVARLRDRGIAGIAGNYDSTVATDYKHCGCRSESSRQEELAHISYEFTRATVLPENKRWLGGLPFSLDLRPLGGHLAGPRLVLVHGTPTLNTLYWTENRSDDFCLKMAAVVGLKAGDAIAFGHTHELSHRVVEGIHFINAGSVGRPKDGDPRAGYVRIELGGAEARVEHVRVVYDIAGATDAVRAAGLPEDFVEFLRTGGRPAPAATAATAATTSA